MKKNWTMKVAALMLALTMITACFVGSTFAKYVTKAEGTDNARVAKWGVLIDVQGNAFDTQYVTHDEDADKDKIPYSVVASNEDYVVAPGTSSEDVEQNLVATVKGTPEVAARYAIKISDWSDVVLPAGTGYVDYTECVYGEGYTKTFDLEKDYAPIKWNLVITGKGQTLDVAEALYAKLPANLLTVAENYGLTEDGCSIFDAVKILKKVASNDQYEQIVGDALGELVSGGSNFMLDFDDEGNLIMSYDFEPNKEMDFTFTLSWEWAFEQENVELYDKADTYLGNIAAEVDGIVVPDGASTEISVTLEASATPID